MYLRVGCLSGLSFVLGGVFATRLLGFEREQVLLSLGAVIEWAYEQQPLTSEELPDFGIPWIDLVVWAVVVALVAASLAYLAEARRRTPPPGWAWSVHEPPSETPAAVVGPEATSSPPVGAGDAPLSSQWAQLSSAEEALASALEDVLDDISKTQEAVSIWRGETHKGARKQRGQVERLLARVRKLQAEAQDALVKATQVPSALSESQAQWILRLEEVGFDLESTARDLASEGDGPWEAVMVPAAAVSRLRFSQDQLRQMIAVLEPRASALAPGRKKV